MSHAYVTNGDGVRELCIYYGSKEVSFDEERLFPFGEQLVSQRAFVAEAATSWGPGYDWSEIRDMLEALVEEGIIKPGDDAEDPRGGGLVPSRLPPSSCPVPRYWSAAECEAITRDLAGRPVEIGNLEAVVATHRIAHPALDADGRQVGEANVFPPGLRLDRDTEWRVCQYTGSRYRDDAPMNVTALKAMIKYWKPIMLLTVQLRDALLQRLPRSRAGWTVGDLHAFARVVLALPAYQLMKGGGTSPQPPLHPVLSSLFRITDGIRMTTHDMLFLSAERTRQPFELTSAAEIYEFAEHNGLFLSEHGVCSGPKAMMEEFFQTVFDGTPVRGTEALELPAEVQALLAELPAALDYGFLGIQTWTVLFSVWLAMRDAYKTLREVVESAASSAGERLRERLRDGWAEMERERIADEYELEVHRVVYADAYEQAWRALRAPVGPAALDDRIAPCAERPQHAEAAARLREILASRFSDADLGGGAAIARIADAAVTYVRAEQGVLAAVTAQQEAINTLLDRPRPTRPLTARDFRVTFLMHPPPISGFPYLFDLLEQELGVRVECTADTITITDVQGG
jgi:hypothetical protein